MSESLRRSFTNGAASALTAADIAEIGSQNDAIRRYEAGGVNQSRANSWYLELPRPLTPTAAVGTDRAVKSTGGQN